MLVNFNIIQQQSLRKSLIKLTIIFLIISILVHILQNFRKKETNILA